MRRKNFQGLVGETVKRTRCGKIQHRKTVPDSDPVDETLLPDYAKKCFRPKAALQLKLFGNPYDPNY
jgi:hypothetical protein